VPTIQIRLIAIEAPAYPRASQSETFPLDVEEGSSVSDVMEKLDLPKSEAYATLVEDMSVPPLQRDSVRIENNQMLTVFSPIKGG